MATVEVAFTPLPAHVRTARLVATAVARRSGVDEELLDEVRLAVGEACSRAVEAHRRHCPAEPIRIEMTDLGERFEVIVRDSVPAEPGGSTSANGAGVTSAQSNGGGPTSAPAGAGQPSSGEAGLDAASTGSSGASGGQAGPGGAADPASTAGPINTEITPFGLAVISGLADDVRISSTGSGVSVRMTWPAVLGAEA
jgi:serine/threonine-protein kinase RsbW